MGDTPAPETSATPDEPSTSATEPAAPAAPVQLPADHPLVKAFEATKNELKSLRDAEKTDLQRATDDLTAERERGTALEAQVARLQAALDHKLDPEDIDLLGTGTPDEIAARAKRLAERAGHVQQNGNRMPNVATGSTATDNPDRTAVRQLFGG